MTSPLVLDLILLVILLFFTLMGAKRGFVLTLCSLVAVIVALVGASFISDALAPKVAAAIQPRLEQVITEQLDEALKHTEFVDGNGDVATSSQDIPLAGVLSVLRENELYQSLMGSVEKAIQEGVSATAASAAAQVAAAIAGQLAKGIIFSVAFLLVLIAWFFVSHALDLVAKLPGLNSLNGLLGGVVGLVKGLIIAYLAVWVLYTLTGTVSQETAQQTRLFLFLSQYGPLELLMAGQVLLGE